MGDDWHLFIAFVLSGLFLEWNTHKKYNSKKVSTILPQKVCNPLSDKVK